MSSVMREIRRADERYQTDGDGVMTRHSFSYGAHYDPDNIGFGPLIAINTETIDPAEGYDQHHHADVEIVTWVLEGVLMHADSTGHRGVVRPGTAQRLSAGTGVQHTEQNASQDEPLVFVQMMLRSSYDAKPEYVDAVVEPRGLTPVIGVHAAAELFVVRLAAGDSITVPASPRSLVHVTKGSIRLDDTTLTGGDEARLTDERAYDLSAAEDGGEALIWQLGSS
ncbi:redox-sensitive bicupin YhaK (pirin superfamily) [Aeromicrobium panaciterrae]|uniref:Redox-sensitive bicupin YhaK (Pirin superfamily) n=1 Tax=Aeromicrobium panaciterrae TaxID=363861 RepID=A0ABU1UL08_9ACTN|nr:pirin family protein [Aeromicrobium panaciterrae]MDR7085872.1 redox-sensitive bicupin YhaK (pirin superfamily) [Aeromicrobium panaciterrae]